MDGLQDALRASDPFIPADPGNAIEDDTAAALAKSFAAECRAAREGAVRSPRRSESLGVIEADLRGIAEHIAGKPDRWRVHVRRALRGLKDPRRKRTAFPRRPDDAKRYDAMVETLQTYLDQQYNPE